MNKICQPMFFFFILSFVLINFPDKTEASVSVSARNAVLIEQNSGRVLFEKNAHEVRRIASITKIMTAILAIESGEMDDMVTVSGRAIRAEGSSIYLKAGEKIKLEDLVYGLMLRSGNDAAVAIAEHVGGSLEGFVFLMNQKAEEIGMSHTHFANPHGLDDSKDHYSTAYDMAVLTRYAMGNPAYRKISGTKIHRAPNPNEQWDRVWRNKNRLLTEKYKYSTGGKTGYTKLAKRTLVSTAAKGDMNLIAVTLNASDDWNDHISMFENAFKQYNLVEILKPGIISKINDSFYKKKVYIENSIVYPLTADEEGQIKIQYELLKPQKNWRNGEEIPNVVGRGIVYLDEQKIKSVPLYFLVKQNEEDSILKIFEDVFMSVLGVNWDG